MTQGNASLYVLYDSVPARLGLNEENKSNMPICQFILSVTASLCNLLDMKKSSNPQATSVEIDTFSGHENRVL
jgi:hypothetical protein